MLSTFSHYSIIYTWNDQNSFRYLLSKEFNPLVIYNTSDNSVALTIDIIDTNNTKCSEYSNGDVKCLYCNEESLSLNMCIECNIELGYYPIILDDRREKYIECYNKEIKLEGFYFDENSKSFKLFYIYFKRQ